MSAHERSPKSDQWNVLNVSGWGYLLVDHVPTGGAGMLEYSPTGNRLLTAENEGSPTRTQ